MAVMSYDDSNLRKLFAAMSPENRRKALKGAFRRTATYVRKAAESNLRSSGIANAGELRRGIWQMVFRREAGFRVSVASKRVNKDGKGGRGMHLNRRGLSKPVLRWAETGTGERRTKNRKKAKVRGKRRWKFAAGAGRGKMPRYGFMSATKSQVEDGVTQMLRREVTDSVKKIAKKYGCS